MQDHVLSCTFCKRSEHRVHKLVAGPGVYICNDCTDRAHAIIHEDAPPPEPSRRSITGQIRRLLASWRGRHWLRRTRAHAV